MNLKLSQIRKDRSAQPRAMLNVDHIKDLADSLEDGSDLTPVDVFHDGHSYWLADGFHRHSAYHRAKRSEIPVTVHEGQLRDAVLYSITANAKHAVLKLTREEKRQSVTRLLKDKEWGQWSNREIGRRAGVDHKTVGGIREEVYAESRGTELTGEFPSQPTPEGSQTPESEDSPVLRKGADGRTINTANIGRSQPTTYRPPLTPDEPEEDDRLEYDENAEDDFEPDTYPQSVADTLVLPNPMPPAADLRVKPEDPAKRRPFERAFTAAGALSNMSDDLIVDALLSAENNMRQTKGSLEIEFQTVVEKIARCLRRAEVEGKTLEVVG